MITLQQLGLFLPQGYLFNNVSLQIKSRDRIGLVGKNGAGKSTLLKLLSGLERPSEGQIHKPNDLSMGMLTQDIEVNSDLSVYEYVKQSHKEINDIQARIEQINRSLETRSDYESTEYLALLDELTEKNDRFQLIGGYQWEEKVTEALEGLGFDKKEFPKTINQFSGGWKMRAELAKLLVNTPDILFLDEPTNHLDIVSIAWLENYLSTFPGALILISHDRLFLDQATNRTWEISNQQIYDFPFAYSKYKQIRAEEIERLTEAQKSQEKEIKRTEELIDKFRAKKNKAAFAQSLIKKLEKTERIQVDKDNVKKLKIRFPLSVQPGKWVLELKQLGKNYGEKTIFKDVSITVGREEKIALLGPNGVGKSTLIKAIMNEIDFSGEVALGHNVNITYFAQNQAEKLDKNKTVFKTVDDIAVGDIRKDLRSILGAFLFSGEDIEKQVGVLSGGERTRLALCQLLLSPSNLLILDEPTNHLDIQSKDVLKEALKQYEGTFIVVSHDREFLNGLTNRIWDIEDQKLKIHHFEIQEYLDFKLKRGEINSSSKIDSQVDTTQKPADEVEETNNYAEQKELKKKRQRLENQVKKLEEQIASIENEIDWLNNKIYNNEYADTQEQNEIFALLGNKQNELDKAMSTWEQVLEELEMLA
jgi:ATP-binding cassette, subfamily F, member 3